VIELELANWLIEDMLFPYWIDNFYSELIAFMVAFSLIHFLSRLFFRKGKGVN